MFLQASTSLISITLAGHSFAHFPQPTHLVISTSAMIPFIILIAPIGQTLMQQPQATQSDCSTKAFRFLFIVFIIVPFLFFQLRSVYAGVTLESTPQIGIPIINFSCCRINLKFIFHIFKIEFTFESAAPVFIFFPDLHIIGIRTWNFLRYQPLSVIQ